MWIAPFWGTFGASRGQQAEQGGASRGSAGSVLELSLQVTGSYEGEWSPVVLPLGLWGTADTISLSTSAYLPLGLVPNRH